VSYSVISSTLSVSSFFRKRIYLLFENFKEAYHRLNEQEIFFENAGFALEVLQNVVDLVNIVLCLLISVSFWLVMLGLGLLDFSSGLSKKLPVC